MDVNPPKQLCLQDLIEALERFPDKDAPMRFDFCYEHPTALHSWRGDYSEIALSHASEGKELTVAQLLQLVKDAIGKEFIGWKGGNYIMHGSTPVWVGNPREAAETAVVAVTEYEQVCILETALNKTWRY